MKFTDLKDKSLEELQKMLKDAKLSLFEKRLQLKTMQLTDTSAIRKARKDIAKISTALSAKKDAQ